MVLPIPFALPIQVGPPTEYALRMRPLYIFILLLQTLTCGFRIFLFLDIWGGFIMILQLAMGWVAVKNHMDIQFICYFGMMCLINGVFDLVRLIDMAVHARVSLFNTKESTMHNVIAGILVAIPTCTLLAVPLCVSLYHDYCGQGENMPDDFGAAAIRRPTASPDNEAAPLLGRQRQSFTPFQGAGHRLGADD
eukprot:gnl/MRDRNA2_/MRDRNA2_19198_c0_seq1.p1 gnl/MRDRNA2_/MRDRNA2_19198_c0~~gnl/MRDRNA2_/MRDRNA2_19198_c0_seq1.p1  ORF type:complete len:193 (+),score=10.89 gnl/MRDRNA2_/MRDRNA2_19198_c0_seq1:65-643(+)